MSPYQSKSSTSYTTDWRDATYSDPAWDEAQLLPDSESNTAKPDSDTEFNSTPTPTMTEQETTNSSYSKVEVVEELSLEEDADRRRLELKVERAFYEAGTALRELRDRRLYRTSNKTFE